MAAAVSTASAAFQGFNYGATFTDGRVKVQSDFENEFKTAAGLEGTNGAFNSARLYTMVQGGTPNQPISAIPAAIKTKTSLLLGLWASAGQEVFNNEIAALKNTIDQYCGQLDGLIAGISVGSEDLYRISPTGIEAGEYAGADPDTLVNYIAEVRKTIQGTCLASAPIGHVDTWTAYANTSNNALTQACDWIGMDAYPYFEDTKHNPVEEGANLFKAAWDQVAAVAGGKDIWVTETGWPVSGKTYGEGVPSLENARTFWEDVGCPMFGSVNVWWYTLQDSSPTTPNPSFGVIGSDLTTTPLYDLSCDGSGSKNNGTSITKPSSSGRGGHGTVTSHPGPVGTGGSGHGGHCDGKGSCGYNSTIVTWSGRISRTTLQPTTSATGSPCTKGGNCGSGDSNNGGNDNGSGSGCGSGSGSGSNCGSGSGSGGSGSGSGSGSGDSGSGSGSGGSGSGSGGTGTGTGSTPTSTIVPGSGAQLNSLGAAAIALVLAAAVL